jgi:hypothetical protein
MIERFAEIKAQLAELATVLNTFKSEAVQLRLLEMILGEGSGEQDTEQSDKIKFPATRKRKSKNKPASSDPAAQSRAKRKSVSSGAGANATLTQLAQNTFFDKPRTIHDIIEHCKHNLARTFKANEFSGKLGRMVRDGELKRKKNGDNQYEYQKA